MNDEERIRAYVRRRADVSVPDDLRLPDQAPPRRRWAMASVSAIGRLVVAGLVVALVAIVALQGRPAPAGPGPSSPPASGGASPAGHHPDSIFPSQVAGLPVVSVVDAEALLQSGALNGRAVAVAGYFEQFFAPCPFPGRYIGPLESWCRIIAFTDVRAAAQLCQPEGSNGQSCGQPSGTNLAPFFVSETSGDVASLTGDASEPAALVVIGHAGDARQWACTAATQAECADAFVVDRVAWADGHDVAPMAPQADSDASGKVLAPRMTLGQVAAATGVGDELLTAAAFRAGDIATIDPRWELAGDDIVWLERSLAPPDASDPAGVRPETVWLVDDATGHVIDSHPLRLAADYQPTRLWQMATVHGVDGNASPTFFAFYRVETGAGTIVAEGQVPGGESNDQTSTTFGGSYGSGPVVLPAGDYLVTSWLATNDGGVMGTPRDECSTRLALAPHDDVTLDAEYPAADQVCTLRLAPSPSP